MGTSGMEKKIDIFGYTDYRKYLADFYAAKKETNPGFSYRVFSRLAGFVSPSILMLVIQGKRNVTQQALSGFCKALNLNAKERRYFELLVQFNQAKDVEAKKHYYEQLFPVSDKCNGTELTHNQYKYMSQWYCPVIREMVGLPGFKEDPRWISKKLKNQITVGEARDALQLLIDLQLVERSERGVLRQTDKNVTTKKDVEHVAAFKFHSNMLEHAKRSLVEDKSGNGREISGITAALSKEQFDKIKKMIRKFENEIMHSLENPEGEADDIYQFNFQLFPLTD